MLGSQAVQVRSGLVGVLVCAVIFLVDKGHRLGLVGWSGVLSILAQYKADHVYASTGASLAIFAVRSGEAKYASARDLAGSSVPTFWFPLLALAADIGGDNTAWGACVCVIICAMLVYAHVIKLGSYGLSAKFWRSTIFSLVFMSAMSPLKYRINFYFSYTGTAELALVILQRHSGFRVPHANIVTVCVVIFAIVESVITAEMYGWDPTPISLSVRLRWMLALFSTMGFMYLMGETPVKAVVEDPSPYTLSGWDHRGKGSNKASRYIVEYISGSEVSSENDPYLEDFHTKWHG